MKDIHVVGKKWPVMVKKRQLGERLGTVTIDDDPHISSIECSLVASKKHHYFTAELKEKSAENAVTVIATSI